MDPNYPYKSCLNPWVQVPQPRIQLATTILDSLAVPGPESEYLDPMILTFRSLVVGEFFRNEFDSKFDGLKPRRGRGSGFQGTKTLVSGEAALWSKTLRVLERMQSLGRLPVLAEDYHPDLLGHQHTDLFWLYALILESEFLMTVKVWHEAGQSGGARKQITLRQGQNALLQALEEKENPFTFPCTKLFIKSAMSAANQDDPFRKNFYTPMVQQRMSVVAGLKKRNARLISDGQYVRQGRTPDDK